MIFAELHGKLGVDYTRAHERAEDLLTSTVFGFLRYLPLVEGVLTLLRRARPVRDAENDVLIQPDETWIDLSQVREMKIDFWPNWPDHGKPDVLLTLSAAADTPVAVLVIEAKLYASKGGRNREDQLVRYWNGLQSQTAVKRGAEAGVIYLTRHSSPPREELADSFVAARQHGKPPGMRLAWMSWRDVWDVAERLASGNLMASDLARLLAYKGFKYFNGFHAKPWQTNSKPRFWLQGAWFIQQPFSCPKHAAGSFWRPEGA